MSLNRIMDQTGQILTASTSADRNNGAALDWSDPDAVDTRYWLSGGSSSEAIDGRDAIVREGRKLYLPADAVITGRNRFRTAEGDVYLVEGAVVAARRPRRGVHHLECTLKLVEG